MAWEPAERVQKNSAGQYRALIGGQWVPVERAQKNSAGQYRVERGAEEAPEEVPAPGQTAETAALAAAAQKNSSLFSGLGTTIPEGFKKSGRSIRRTAVDVLPDTLDKPPPGVPYEEVDRYGGPRGYYEAMYGLKSDEDLALAKEQIQESLTAEAKESEQKIQAATPKDLSFLQRGVRGGIESLAANAPGLVASVLTGSPIPALAAAGAQTGFGSYEDARAAGKDAMDALAYGGVDAALEVATEFLPTKYLMKMFKADSLKGVKSQIAKFAIGEIGGEEVATLTQSLNAAAHGLDDQLNDPNLSIGDKINVQLERQALTAISTVIAGGTQAGVASALAYGRQKPDIKEFTPEQTVAAIDEQIAGYQTRIAQLEAKLKIPGAWTQTESRGFINEAKQLEQEVATLNQIRKKYAPTKEGEKTEETTSEGEKGEVVKTEDKSVKLKGNVTLPTAEQVPPSPAFEGFNELEQRALDTVRMLGNEQSESQWNKALRGMFNIDAKGAGILLSRLKKANIITGRVNGVQSLVEPSQQISETAKQEGAAAGAAQQENIPAGAAQQEGAPAGAGAQEFSDEIPYEAPKVEITNPANPVYQQGAEGLKQAAIARKSINVPNLMKATGLKSEPARQLMDAYEQAGLVSKPVQGKRKYLGELPERGPRTKPSAATAVAGAGATGVKPSVQQQGVPGAGAAESTQPGGLDGTGEPPPAAPAGKRGVEPALTPQAHKQMQDMARVMLRAGAITNESYNKIILDSNLALNPVDDTGEPLTELPDFKPTGKLFNEGVKRFAEIQAGKAKPVQQEVNLPDEEEEKAAAKKERAVTGKGAKKVQQFMQNVAKTEGVKVATEAAGPEALTGEVTEKEAAPAAGEEAAAPKKRGRPKKVTRESRTLGEITGFRSLVGKIGTLSQRLADSLTTLEDTVQAQREAPQQTKESLEGIKLADAVNGKTVLEALDVVIESASEPTYRAIATHLRSLLNYMYSTDMIAGIPVIVKPKLEKGVTGMADLIPQVDKSRGPGILNMGVRITLGKDTIDYKTLLHEIVHGALLPVVTFARAAKYIGLKNDLTAALDKYEEVGNRIAKDLMRLTRNRSEWGGMRPFIEDAMRTNIFTRENGRITGVEIDELYSWGLTDPGVQTLFRSMPYRYEGMFKNAYEAIAGTISRMLGFKPSMDNALSQILAATTHMANTANALIEVRGQPANVIAMARVPFNEIIQREAKKYKAPPAKVRTPEEQFKESEAQLEAAAGGKKGFLARTKEFLTGQSFVKLARDIQNYRYVLKEIQNGMEMTKEILYENVGTKGFNNFYDRMVSAAGLTKRIMLSRVLPKFNDVQNAAKKYSEDKGITYKEALARVDKILKALHLDERRRTKFMLFAPLDNVNKNYKIALANGQTKMVSAAEFREYVWGLLHTNLKFNTDAERDAWYKTVDKYRDDLMQMTDEANPNNALNVNGTSLADSMEGTEKKKPGKRSIKMSDREYNVLGTYYPQEIASLIQEYQNDPNKAQFDEILKAVRDIQNETVKIDEEANYWTQGVSNIRQFYGWKNYVALTGKAETSVSQEDDVLEFTSPRYSAEYKGQVVTGFKGAQTESQNALIATQIAATRAAMRLGLKDSRQAIRNALVQKILDGKPKETIKFEDRVKGLDPVKYQGNKIFLNYNKDGSIEVWELTNKEQRDAIRREFEAEDPNNIFLKAVDAAGNLSSSVAQFFTRYNPAFGFKNFVRDVFTYSTVFARLGPKKMAEYMGNVAVDVARIGLYKAGRISYLWNKGRLADIEKLAAKDARFYRPAYEFLNNGGESVFVQQFVKLSRLKDIMERHNVADADSKSKLVKEVLDAVVDTWASSFELTARVSAYRIRKAEIMAANPSLSDEAAQASAAAWTKEIQNFESVGQKVRRISKLYYFFRPGSTGAVRAVEVMRPLLTYDVNKLLQQLPDNIKKDPAAIRKAEIQLRNDRKNVLLSTMAMMGAGYALYMMMYGMGGDDDEDRNVVATDQKDMWIRNLRIPLSPFGLGEPDEFFQIPWGLGAGSVMAMGAQIAAFTNGHMKSGGEFLSNLGQIAANSYLPIQPVQFNPFDPTEGAKSIPRNLLIATTFPVIPSILRTPLEYLVNVNSLGQQIYRTQMSKYGDAYVDIERIPEMYNSLAKFVERVTDGRVDVGPEFWYYLVNNSVAGLGNLVADTYSLTLSLLGEKEFDPKRDTVFFSSFFAKRPSPDAKQYEHVRYEIEKMQQQIKKLDSLAAIDPENERAIDYRDKHGDVDGLIQVYKENKVLIDKLREQSNRLRAGQAGQFTVGERKEAVKDINDQINRYKIDMIEYYKNYKEDME